MKSVIFGLGNPGIEFLNTRHNFGRERLDKFLNLENETWKKFNNHGEYFKLVNGSNEVFFLKTTTLYMNESGILIREFIDFFKISIDNVIVVYDEMNYPLGEFKLREKGSSGGHNGIKDIIKYLGTENVKRVRLGIGTTKGEKKNFVIGKFSGYERIIVNKVDDIICDLFKEWIVEPNFQKLMNKYNNIKYNNIKLNEE